MTIRSKAWCVKAISYIYHYHAVQNCPDNFLQRDTINLESFRSNILLLAKIVISIVVITANVFQGCAITHHNLADSLAVIDGKGGIVWANFGQLTKVDTAREMWIILRNKLQKLISQNCELVTKFRGLLTNGLLLFASFYIFELLYIK